MRRRTMLIVASVAALAALALGGAAIAGATQGDEGEQGEQEQTLSGAAAERAKTAALKETGGGSVTEVERDDGSAYEVEVKKPDGTTVDLVLDSSFKVVGVDDDKDQGNEKNEQDAGGKTD